MDRGAANEPPGAGPPRRSVGCFTWLAAAVVGFVVYAVSVVVTCDDRSGHEECDVAFATSVIYGLLAFLLTPAIVAVVVSIAGGIDDSGDTSTDADDAGRP